MEKVVCGHYRYDDEKDALTQACTHQTIRVVHLSIEGVLSFEYSDDEARLDFVVKARMVNASRWIVSLDWNAEESAIVRQCYGLWRRVIFFVLDAIPVWFSIQHPERRLWKFEACGGWKNGVWNRGVVVRSTIVNPHGKKLDGPSDDVGYPLTPLELKPFEWEYRSVPNPQLECSLQVDERPDGARVLRLSRSVTRSILIESQLKDVPRFVRKDGNACLFHHHIQANFHRGEDYAPIPYYGYVNERCAFTLRAFFAYGVDTFLDPILGSEEVPFESCFERVYTSPTLQTVNLALPLREELLFALIDIQAALAANQSEMPVITERDGPELRMWRNVDRIKLDWGAGVKFGSNLGRLSGLPFTNRLGMTNITF